MTGVLARMGQRVLSGVARMFTNQFFQDLEREFLQVKEQSPAEPDSQGG